jgi:hypothetical protein
MESMGMHLKELERDILFVHWTHGAQNWGQWWALLNIVAPKKEFEHLKDLSNY